ncbi:ArsR/SmtB family transcription factor [Paenibacillus mucilaginosus]|uniref:Transcriptional regulator n=2 Tax=Paenibacillus mucilaginosus TaxID=61624 RepID=I0BJ04_9BACL|nr:helix-turn-helix domain-containing protein [Paenibacillus mucilaginosus]AEI41556.1 Activator of Hsp90 ATPase 1 family protein [Paenibacillus mucilaginosus KNP414]AFH62351.1 transcriptional regulator [Paenibacillus mucilaginosus K02]MCG7215409.1 helix-turn-helix domain-containing protein [Paenibacillus mucilaginosus]WDM30559.1 helix-turn-helix domain-containing protein [Paenibacillus mucilaginosus]WFA18741.1 ArsR family transcriptional regulator [Paenibacillus mucilaginosus]
MTTVQSKDSAIFLVLADPRCRELLQRLAASPGLSVSGLSDELELPRAAVLKHLKMLEEAELAASRRIGREKLYSADRERLRGLMERLLGRPEDTRGGRLGELKRMLSEEKQRSVRMLPRQTYGTLIRSSPARIWEEVLSPEQPAGFWRGCRLILGGGELSPYRLERPDGREEARGMVTAAEAQRRLELTWGSPDESEAGTAEGRLALELERLPGRPEVCRVILVLTAEIRTEDSIRAADGGWPGRLAGLKSYVETGEGMWEEKP